MTETETERTRRVGDLIGPLWQGRRGHLPPLTYDDAEWSARAVRLALTTPDLCLLRSCDGVAARHTASEIVSILLRTGRSVIVAAADAADAEALLPDSISRFAENRKLRDRLAPWLDRWPASESSLLQRLLGKRTPPPPDDLPPELAPLWPRPGLDVQKGRDRLQSVLHAADEAMAEFAAHGSTEGHATWPGAGDGPNADALVAVDVHAWDRVTLERMLARADRWVLLGDPSGDTPFAQLWRSLNAEPWSREGDRLRCRLLPLDDAQRHELTVEPLADAPDIELRIRHPAGGRPQLAEVVFPPGTDLAAAKEFVARQLEEWPVELDTAALRWEETSDRVVACCGCQGQHAELPAEPAPGVKELIAERPADAGELPWYTCGFIFDRAAGWDRPRAQAWLRSLLDRQFTARTARI